MKPVDGYEVLNANVDPEGETMQIKDLKASFRYLVQENAMKHPDRIYYLPKDREIKVVPGKSSLLTARVGYVERRIK